MNKDGQAVGARWGRAGGALGARWGRRPPAEAPWEAARERAAITSVGIDVAKAHLDSAMRPGGEQWVGHGQR
jgi:hypothetical protein